MSIFNPSILSTKAYGIIKEDFEAAIEKIPNCVCDTHCSQRGMLLHMHAQAHTQCVQFLCAIYCMSKS